MYRQYKREHFATKKKFGHKERDSTDAYLDIRNRIIKSHDPHLNDSTVKRLAHLTRGKNVADIIACVKDFNENSVEPESPTHPTNTCDPNTGNWCEHLLNIGHLKKILSEEGFSVQILAGTHGIPTVNYKKPFAYGLNHIINNTGTIGLVLAPVFILYGKRISNSKT